MHFKYMLSGSTYDYYATNLNDIANAMDISLRTLKYHIQQGKKHVNIIKKSLFEINNEYGNYKLYPSRILIVHKKTLNSAENETNEEDEDI